MRSLPLRDSARLRIRTLGSTNRRLQSVGSPGARIGKTCQALPCKCPDDAPALGSAESADGAAAAEAAAAAALDFRVHRLAKLEAVRAKRRRALVTPRSAATSLKPPPAKEEFDY
ncbi:unnamed protein product [Lampetra fluviatilis]